MICSRAPGLWQGRRRNFCVVFPAERYYALCPKLAFETERPMEAARVVRTAYCALPVIAVI